MREVSRSDNGVKLRIDDDDDLWTLARICREGTSAGMLSHRRDSTTGTQEGGRSKQAERKPMWIVLRVEEAGFQPFTDNLRLHGVISEAPMDVGSYHTHIIEAGDEIELSWEGGIDSRDLQLIESAVADGQRSRVGLIVVENDEILLFEVAKHGIRDVSSFSMRGGGKRGKDSSAVRSDFYSRVAKEACLVFGSSMPVAICGPGLARERFETNLREACGIVKILNVATSIGGRAAANEVISEGLADSLLGEYAIVHEVRAIEEALRRVSVDGAAAYGIKEIQFSAEQGAVECLVIEASLLREEGLAAKWKSISDAVTTGGGSIIQASMDHDAGKQLMGFGGALALLRWRA
ncbi:MAG TPA: pelota family protein [Candidatus Thalassarchaeaceae archaeon]|nr:MAG TPA: hypothetical protein D7H98_03260 [Candidatus Poseidoniales archaeon]HII90007.1 pelota family protein [Candidatus Thalassarchaeaceae archaeon]|tara:strand:+ start:1570 stop:2619 length:1050 start_codon:yes stop_codon:yes gene_type:complete